MSPPRCYEPLKHFEDLPPDSQSGAGIWVSLLLDYNLARDYNIRLYGYYSTSNGSKKSRNADSSTGIGQGKKRWALQDSASQVDSISVSPALDH